MRKAMNAAVLLLSVACLVSVVAVSAGEAETEPAPPTDTERARWTMGDMKTLAIVLQAYHKDNGKYPLADTLEAAIPVFEPVYVKKAPRRDAWGTAFRYIPTPDQSGYRIVSAGADRKFDEASWGAETGEAEFHQDVVVSNGEFMQRWAYR